MQVLHKHLLSLFAVSGGGAIHKVRWIGYLLEIQHGFVLGTNATLQIYRKI